MDVNFPKPKGNLVSAPTLEEFERFMFSKGSGWTLVNKTDKMLAYQKAVPARRGSCLVAALLFLLGILPGILYMFYGRKEGRTLQLAVTVDAKGTPLASGDAEGLSLYSSFINSVPRNLVKS